MARGSVMAERQDNKSPFDPEGRGSRVTVRVSNDHSRFENRPPPWGKDVDAEPVSFGTWLRRQREMRGVDLRDIAERTKISLRYLEAMEEDRFDILPAPIFAKGFLREYARHVGLSPDEVVNHFLAVHQPPADTEPVLARERSARGRSLVQTLL